MSSTPLRVLVTGVGGDLGQSIVKCLRLMETHVQILGCDISRENIGSAFVDEYLWVSNANDKDYLSRIAGICQDSEVQAVIPGSEPEIFALSYAVFRRGFPLGAKLVCQEYAWLETYGDKLGCFRALDGRVELATYFSGRDENMLQTFLEEGHFPCIVKSRRSWGSKSLRVVSDEEKLYNLLMDDPELVIQEYIDDEYGEFSVGAFSCDEFVSAIAFKRELGPIGASWYADNFDQDDDVLEYAHKIVEVSGLRGSANIQVRKSAKGVRLLEINPRFSSLVAARAACGFRDLEWSVAMALGEPVAKPKLPFKPLRFRRYFHELIDMGDGYRGIEEWLPSHKPLKSF